MLFFKLFPHPKMSFSTYSLIAVLLLLESPGEISCCLETFMDPSQNWFLPHWNSRNTVWTTIITLAMAHVASFLPFLSFLLDCELAQHRSRCYSFLSQLLQSVHSRCSINVYIDWLIDVLTYLCRNNGNQARSLVTISQDSVSSNLDMSSY